MSTATNADSAVQSASIAARIGRWIGPLLAVFCYFSLSQIEDVPPEAPAAASVILLIGIWWMTEAIPLAVTSLLPLVLFPIFSLGDISVKDVAQGYSHPLIFLFIGGFILSIAIEKWNLHKRIAVIILNKVGSNLKNIMLGFQQSRVVTSTRILEPTPEK